MSKLFAVVATALLSGLFGAGAGAAPMYVTNPGSPPTIYKIAENGATSSVYSNPMVRDLKIDAAGVLYVSTGNDNSIIKITQAGAVSTFVTGLINPIGMAFDKNGNLYVSNWNANEIKKITPAGVVNTYVSGLPAHASSRSTTTATCTRGSARTVTCSRSLPPAR
jgi:hypothetical protein